MQAVALYLQAGGVEADSVRVGRVHTLRASPHLFRIDWRRPDLEKADLACRVVHPIGADGREERRQVIAIGHGRLLVIGVLLALAKQHRVWLFATCGGDRSGDQLRCLGEQFPGTAR